MVFSGELQSESQGINNEQFQRSLPFLKMLLDSSRDIVIRAVDTNYRYLFFNNAYKNAIKLLYGVDISVGADMMDCIAIAADRKRVRGNFDRAFSGESHSSIDSYGENGDIYFENYFSPIRGENGAVIGALTFGIDITERKKTEEALRQSESQFKTLFMSISDGFYLSEALRDDRGDPVDYRYLEVNPKFEEILGLGREQIVGKRYKEIVPVDTTEWLRNYCEVARTGKPSAYEFYSDEYKMYFETFAYKTAKGQIAVFVRNITERKNTENALQNAQKLESLGILAGGIAHDFNNMLCGLFGYIDLAKSYLSSNKAQDAARALSGALRSFEMLSSLANQLLTFSKGGAPCRKATALESIIKASGSLAVSGSNVRCRFDIAADLMACDCDGNQVSQVLTNIIINAKQAMPSGGEVVVTARNVVLLPDQNAHLPKGGNFIRISIKDHGVGIPLHILKNIFDPFFTTKETGHGLGLSTAFSIIKRHDGSIDVESEPGIGAVFHVYIPAATAAAPPDSEEIPEVYEGKGPVLVMDDDESIRSIYGDMIGLLGHTVVTAESGEEAIRLFKESIDANRPFCGTILDLTIKGGKGGMETLREIRRLQPRAKVVVASGYSNSPVMSNPSEMGFDGSLAKPFTTGDIVRLFRRIFT